MAVFLPYAIICMIKDYKSFIIEVAQVWYIYFVNFLKKYKSITFGQ
jgi:hypothetical protein